MQRLTFLFVLLSACSTGRPVGEACGGNNDCASKVCVPFPGGYCTTDCTSKVCASGETCAVVGVVEVCLKECSTANDCRAGYQCFNNGCQPACGQDTDCGPKGYLCTDGTCMVKPGDPVGAACMEDDDCSSDVCLLGKCQEGCTREADCAAMQTCYYNPTGDVKATPTTQIVPICVPRRVMAALGTACSLDTDCIQGSCQLGMCTEMCVGAGDCTRSGTECVDLAIVLDNKTTPALKGCLPSNTVIDFDGASGKVALPSTGQSFAIYTHVEPFNFMLAVGVTSLTDGLGTAIYTQPSDQADFEALPVRYEPTEASSTMLVPNAPMRVTLMPGVYKFTAGTSGTPADPSVRVYMKLHDGAITTGSLPLNIYYTDLSGACRPTTFAQLQASSGTFMSSLATLKTIYQQAGITISGINYFDVSKSVGNSIRVSTSTAAADQLADLDMMLQGATSAVTGATPGFDVVILRTITDQNGNQSGVLGVAGGIPANPVLGTAHSGVVVSLETLCFGGATTFGSTMGHELGHSVGLFHNVEQDGSTDPLTDTMMDGQNNLMYWVEDSGEHLSTQQGQVVRGDPKVHL